MKGTKELKNAMLPAILLITAITFAQTPHKPFRVSPERPTPGTTITISYDPDGTILEGLAPVKGMITLYRNYAWETQDLEMHMTDSGWAASYPLPKDASLIACNFSAAGKVDKGGKATYAWMLSDGAGKQAPGAFAGWALLRAKDFRNRVPDLTEDSASITDDVVMFWMRNEVRDHPESRKKIFYEALTTLKRTVANRADSTILVETTFAGTRADVSEDDLLKIRSLYRLLAGGKQKVDSIEQVILSKYPNGKLAWDQIVYTMFRETNAEKRDSIWKAFSRRFSVADSKYMHSEIADMYYAKVYRAIVFNEIIAKNNYGILAQMAPDAPLSCLIDFHRHIVEYPQERLDEQKRTPGQVIGYSKTLIAAMEKASTDRQFPEGFRYSASQWKERCTRLFAGAYKAHAQVLAATGNPAGALVYAERAKPFNGYRNADFNGLYTSLLLKNDRRQEVTGFIESCVRENAATPEMLAVLKEQYKKKKGNDGGFDEYVNSLKSNDKQKALQARLKASLINKPIASFNLESNKGGKVDLAKQKGRIVVLDFWATWCGPCKAAMPGMQLAANKFKNDRNVAFYFIATQESKPDYRTVIGKFLKEKGYDFNVLYDAKSPGSGKLDDTYSRYAKSIGFSGIPQKMIIDGKGNLRWRSTGYMGSPTELADEISYIIELLKAESLTLPSYNSP